MRMALRREEFPDRRAVEQEGVLVVERLQPVIVSLYRERRDALCAALEEHLCEWFAFAKPVGGMFVWAVARSPGLDTDRLLSAALEAGVPPSLVVEELQREVERRLIRTRAFYDEF